MTPTRRELTALAFALPLSAAGGGARSNEGPAAAPVADAKAIALGGAAGGGAPWTKAAYVQAIREGADILAGGVAPTKDGLLVVRPDAELSATTDVAARSEFAPRRKRALFGGKAREGWFVEDFTLAELKTLRAAPAPGRRAPPEATAILAFEELVAIARAGSVATGRVVGVQAMLVHPAYFAPLDLALEPRVSDAIKLAGYNSPAAAMTVASLSGESLKAIGDMTRARRMLRIEAGSPAAKATASAQGLRTIRGFCEGIAPDAALLIDLSQPKTLPPGPLIGAAHAAGLAVTAWAAGGDPPFPPPPFKPSDERRIATALFAAGCDAVAAEQAAPAARARAAVVNRKAD